MPEREVLAAVAGSSVARRGLTLSWLIECRGAILALRLARAVRMCPEADWGRGQPAWARSSTHDDGGTGRLAGGMFHVKHVLMSSWAWVSTAGWAASWATSRQRLAQEADPTRSSSLASRHCGVRTPVSRLAGIRTVVDSGTVAAAIVVARTPKREPKEFHVKHSNDYDGTEIVAELRRALSVGVRELECEIATSDQETMLSYLLAVLQANRHLNLTRIVDPLEAVRLHLLDSLAAAPELAQAPSGDGIDIGSGAGFPGVPLAIESGRHFTLLDSVGKKTRAVQGVLDEFGDEIPARAVSARAEELARSFPACYSVAVARAVAPLQALVELASPLLKQNGRLIALKAQLSEQELQSGVHASSILGMTMVGSRVLVLPGSEESRTILVFDKVGAPKVDLPRRTGLAQHQPLV